MDDTEARIVCDSVAGEGDGWAGGPMSFTIYTAEEQSHGSTGYTAVVTAVHEKKRGWLSAQLKWSTCYTRKGVTSDPCGCKCHFLLHALPSRMSGCRCVKGV
jgi:hypothetical protein